jgi:maltoporin
VRAVSIAGSLLSFALLAAPARAQAPSAGPAEPPATEAEPEAPAPPEAAEEDAEAGEQDAPRGVGIPRQPTIYEPPAGADPQTPSGGGAPPAPRVEEGRADALDAREPAADDEGDEDDDDDDGEADEDEDEDAHHGAFYFGSYGRIVAASDLEGRTGRQSNLTAWGPRVDESDTYAEIELRREDHFAGMDTQIVATIAYGGPLFHYDGEFDERIAIRNLFAETRNLLTPGLAVWAGSRMWRGDDVYLFNMWPLDNLNLVGGGLRYALEDIGELSVAGGLAQPNDPFQRQEVLVPARVGFDPETVVFLDRPRLVFAGKLTWWPFGRFERTGMKAILYGEGHYLPAGDRQDEEGFTERLPQDAGWAVGAQVGGYIADSRTFANLFVRYGRGLGAYDPLGVPFRSGSVIQTGRAEELRVALSANWEYELFGLQVGAYYRYFRDADPNVFDRGALSEGAINLRPMVWLGRFVGIAADVSYQGLQTTALNETTRAPEGGNVFKLGIIPFVSPFGRGTYTRPHIRLIYSLTVRDDDARALYPALDPRSANNVEHFLGVGVEWWFSSTSYGS